MEIQIAKAAVGRALQGRRWTLYGEPWSGIAQRDQFILVVDVPWNSSVMKRSGLGKPMRGLLGMTLCRFCRGTTRIEGAKPCVECDGGLTYESSWVTFPDRWPVFRPNPQGQQWHVQVEGAAVGTITHGRGLTALGRIVTPELQDMRAAQLVHKIEGKLGYCACPVCQSGTGTSMFCWSCKGVGNMLMTEV